MKIHYPNSFELDQTLAPLHLAYLRIFTRMRHVRWWENVLTTLPDPLREAVGLPIGPDGSYYVGGVDRQLLYYFASDDPAIQDYNWPPKQKPSLHCPWEPTSDGQAIHCHYADRFYDATEWITYLIDHFFISWGYVLTGTVAQSLTVQDNVIVKDETAMV